MRIKHMITDRKIKQKDLKTIRVFHNSDSTGSVVGIYQGKHEIYLDPRLAKDLAGILAGIEWRLTQEERDFYRYNDETNYPAEL